ncbi:MAG TPA: cold shock domain-containing protein [Sandaracinaceae bacterium LLY-WYZ-13_1]|nr:cold shock domain-containing protein [Sandaracinaceae bacterium LLY-WYZ-13_1]
MDHLELRITDISDRDYAERLVHEQVAKLERHTPSITSCHVAIERPHAHPTSGAPYRTRIEVRLAGADPFVIRREQGDGDVRDDLSKIVHDAFGAADRKARELARQQRGAVKRHPTQQMAGIVTELHADYGIVFSADGRKIYFHANSVIDHPFDELREGMGVAFLEEAGDEGPQASTLRVVDARGRGRVDERPPS